MRFCVLHGSEQMLMRLFVDGLRGALESEHGPVETVRFEGQSATLADVFDHLRSWSLLETHKLVVVDGADPFVTAHRQALERYAQTPQEQATLVLRSGRWHRGNLDKHIQKVGCIVKCEPLPAAQAQAWLIDRARTQHQRVLVNAAARMLVDRVGCDLMKLDSELAKLAVSSDATIQPDQVLEMVPASGGDEQAWSIQEAILASFATPSSAGGGLAVEKIHQLVERSGQPEVLVSYFVADLVRKLYLGQMMHAQGHSEQQIADRFKLWGPRRNLFMKFLKRLDGPVAGRLFDQMVRFDARAKTGLGSPMRNLENFCLTLAGQLDTRVGVGR